MRIVVTGGRDHRPDATELSAFDTLWLQLGGTVLVCGRARGVDTLLERHAEERGWTVEPHPADWNRWGRAAGTIRNGEMLDGADVLIAFKGGKGTANCVSQAIQRGVPVYEVTPSGKVIPP